jgi:nicotinamide phosphoribosyltransferase
MRLRINTVLLADAYKYVHWRQIPKGTTAMASYSESRGTDIGIDYTRPFGMQGFIMDYLRGNVIKKWMIDEAVELLGEVFGTHEYFNEKGFRRLLEVHKGKLPLRIKTVKEGTKLPLHNIQNWCESTDDEFAWLVPWIETMLLRAAWYGTTVCTVSSAVRDIEKEFAEICGCDLNPFKLNDFGARGVSSHESAEIGGAAHLVNYLGTDNMEGLRWAKHRYGKVATGYSVYATEHSTTTIYLKTGEKKAYTWFLTDAPKDKIVSIVPDSYDYENAVRNILGKELKHLILARTAPTVIRPDSGDPIEISLKTAQWLWEDFGGTVNEKGFKVLNPLVRILYGDGINLKSIRVILNNLVDNGFSMENIIFGMGGKLLQADVNRDTFQNACKLCWAIVDGKEIEIYKDPATSSAKKSKKGRQKLIFIDGQYKTVRQDEYPDYPDQLVTVFENGKLLNKLTFDQVRANATL